MAEVLTLQPDLVKLDRALMAGVGHNIQKQLLVRAVRAWTDDLGIGLLAEGVETAGTGSPWRFRVRLSAGVLLGEARGWLAERVPGPPANGATRPSNGPPVLLRAGGARRSRWTTAMQPDAC